MPNGFAPNATYPNTTAQQASGVSVLAAFPTTTLGAHNDPVTLQAFNGAPPYTWSVTSGALPTGWSLDSSTGIVTLLATASGSFSFTITATDSNSATGSAPFTAQVLPAYTAWPQNRYSHPKNGPFGATKFYRPPTMALNPSVYVSTFARQTLYDDGTGAPVNVASFIRQVLYDDGTTTPVNVASFVRMVLYDVEPVPTKTNSGKGVGVGAKGNPGKGGGKGNPEQPTHAKRRYKKDRALVLQDYKRRSYTFAGGIIATATAAVGAFTTAIIVTTNTHGTSTNVLAAQTVTVRASATDSASASALSAAVTSSSTATMKISASATVTPGATVTFRTTTAILAAASLTTDAGLTSHAGVIVHAASTALAVSAISFSADAAAIAGLHGTLDVDTITITSSALNIASSSASVNVPVDVSIDAVAFIRASAQVLGVSPIFLDATAALAINATAISAVGPFSITALGLPEILRRRIVSQVRWLSS